MFFLEVDNVEKHFSGLRALPGATLKVGKGEVRVLVGPNGSGKATLFNVISGLLKP
jgi:ABC-type branched-subunit amino acid transport system ATPase component